MRAVDEGFAGFAAASREGSLPAHAAWGVARLVIVKKSDAVRERKKGRGVVGMMALGWCSRDVADGGGIKSAGDQSRGASAKGRPYGLISQELSKGRMHNVFLKQRFDGLI